MVNYVDLILRTRVYDLLYLEYKIERRDLVAAQIRKDEKAQRKLESNKKDQ